MDSGAGWILFVPCIFGDVGAPCCFLFHHVLMHCTPFAQASPNTKPSAVKKENKTGKKDKNDMKKEEKKDSQKSEEEEGENSGEEIQTVKGPRGSRAAVALALTQGFACLSKAIERAAEKKTAALCSKYDAVIDAIKKI